MVEAKKKESPSHWWWLDSHSKGNSTRSPWLQTTLAELDEKTKTMLKLIEEEADSFSQRAEMYYKKRPELITMVEDFYRTHRSLAERYDQAKSEPATRHLSSPWSSPLSFTKYRLDKSPSLNDKAYDSYSEAYGLDESDESEVDDPDEEEEYEKVSPLISETKEGSNGDDDPDEKEEYEKVSPLISETKEGLNGEIVRLKEEVKSLLEENEAQREIVRLKEEVKSLLEENEAQREQLMQKDEEKREVIRQLSLAMDLLREENEKLRECLVMKTPKKENKAELKGSFFGRLFDGFGKTTPANLVAL